MSKDKKLDYFIEILENIAFNYKQGTGAYWTRETIQYYAHKELDNLRKNYNVKRQKTRS